MLKVLAKLGTSAMFVGLMTVMGAMAMMVWTEEKEPSKTGTGAGATPTDKAA